MLKIKKESLKFFYFMKELIEDLELGGLMNRDIS